MYTPPVVAAFHLLFFSVESEAGGRDLNSALFPFCSSLIHTTPLTHDSISSASELAVCNYAASDVVNTLRVALVEWHSECTIVPIGSAIPRNPAPFLLGKKKLHAGQGKSKRLVPAV